MQVRIRSDDGVETEWVLLNKVDDLRRVHLLQNVPLKNMTIEHRMFFADGTTVNNEMSLDTSSSLNDLTKNDFSRKLSWDLDTVIGVCVGIIVVGGLVVAAIVSRRRVSPRGIVWELEHAGLSEMLVSGMETPENTMYVSSMETPKNTMSVSGMEKNRKFVDSSNQPKNPTNPKKYDERRNPLDVLNDLSNPVEINQKFDEMYKLNTLDESYELDDEKLKKITDDGYASKLSLPDKDPSPKYEFENSNFFGGDENLKSVDNNVDNPLFPESSLDEMTRQAHPNGNR